MRAPLRFGPMSRIELLAPAKVNLALHVTGQRADGYHLLDSLVAFAPFGDRLSLCLSKEPALRVTGPEARGVPEGPENLVLKAAEFAGQSAEITLEKGLPAASGIGGGSSDAAAVLRGLAALGVQIPAKTELLGADVPMCLTPHPARARGIGEALSPVVLPPLPAVLLNPRIEISTPAVFKALTWRDNPPLPDIPVFSETADCIDWLARLRNDLEPPAIALAPVVSTALTILRATPGCRLARMSGSGATCFALYETEAEAEAALTRLRIARPRWWSAAGVLGDQTALAHPLHHVIGEI